MDLDTRLVPATTPPKTFFQHTHTYIHLARLTYHPLKHSHLGPASHHLLWHLCDIHLPPCVSLSSLFSSLLYSTTRSPAFTFGLFFVYRATRHHAPTPTRLLRNFMWLSWIIFAFPLFLIQLLSVSACARGASVRFFWVCAPGGTRARAHAHLFTPPFPRQPTHHSSQPTHASPIQHSVALLIPPTPVTTTQDGIPHTNIMYTSPRPTSLLFCSRLASFVLVFRVCVLSSLVSTTFSFFWHFGGPFVRS